MKNRTVTYRASNHVIMGSPTIHAYNMFLSVIHMCYRLSLFETNIPEPQMYGAWCRSTQHMRGK